MNTHNGKIGRLPGEIREQINQRLAAGDMAGPILEWLNGLPVVKAVVAEKFGGNQINEQNLSNWRAGGFLHWQHQQERLNLAQMIVEDAQALEASAGAEGAAAIGKHLSTILMVEFIQAVRNVLPGLKDPMEHWRYTEKFLRLLSKIRREDHQDARMELDRKRGEFQRNKETPKPEVRRETAEAASADQPIARPSQPGTTLVASAAEIQRGVQEVSKVLDLYPDIPEPYALNQGWCKQIKVNQGRSR